MTRFLAALTLMTCFSACGDPAESDPMDGGIDSARPSTDIDPPLPPEAPRIEECPAGWVRSEDSLEPCVPWMDRPSCGEFEAQYPGDASCSTIGASCPAGEFPEGLMGDVRYVSVDAVAGGTGSMESPFATLDEALAAPGANPIVALGRGVHTIEFIELPDGTRLVGACAEQTRIESTYMEGGRGLIALPGGEATISNVSVGGSLIGLVAALEGVMRLEGVLVDGAQGSGMLALSGSRIEGEDVVVRNILPDRGTSVGIAASRGEVALSRVYSEGGTASVFVARESSRVELTSAHLVVAEGSTSENVNVNSGALELVSSLVEGGVGSGVVVGAGRNEGTSATLRDVVIREVDPLEGGGAGLLIGGGSRLDAERVFIDRVVGTGIYVQDSTASLSDILIRDCNSAEITGAGITLLGSDVDLQRVSIVDTEGAGLLVAKGSELRASDVRIERNLPSTSMPFGPSVIAAEDATLLLERAQLVNNGGGVVVGTGSTATLTDVQISDGTAEDDMFQVGTGFVIADESEATLRRVRIERALSNGIVAEGSSIDGEHIEVVDTRERRCPSGCGMSTFGSGVVVTQNGYIRLARFSIRGSALAGLRLFTGGEMDLSEGDVSGNPLGVDIHTEGFDRARVSDRVVFDNDRNLQSDVPAPDVVIPTF